MTNRNAGETALILRAILMERGWMRVTHRSCVWLTTGPGGGGVDVAAGATFAQRRTLAANLPVEHAMALLRRVVARRERKGYCIAIDWHCLLPTGDDDADRPCDTDERGGARTTHDPGTERRRRAIFGNWPRNFRCTPGMAGSG